MIFLKPYPLIVYGALHLIWIIADRLGLQNLDCAKNLEMAVASKTRNMLEGLVRDGSFKWLLGNHASINGDENVSICSEKLDIRTLPICKHSCLSVFKVSIIGYLNPCHLLMWQ